MENGNTNPNGIRIIELPSCKMAASFGTDLNEFDKWWSEVDKRRTDKFYPRDFMYHDGIKNQLIWLYALPVDAIKSCKYTIIDFTGGLYAAAVSIDQNDIDGERVYKEIKDWIQNTGYFSIDKSKDRYTLFHVITTDTAFGKMKYRQLDIYVPVK